MLCGGEVIVVQWCICEMITVWCYVLRDILERLVGDNVSGGEGLTSWCCVEGAYAGDRIKWIIPLLGRKTALMTHSSKCKVITHERGQRLVLHQDFLLRICLVVYGKLGTRLIHVQFCKYFRTIRKLDSHSV